jgi:small redox-active disulfide protein 2
MEVVVIGGGYTNCRNVYSTIDKLIEENGIHAKLRKEEDIMIIATYGITDAPVIIVDGEVKIRGYVPSEAEIKKALGIKT